MYISFAFHKASSVRINYTLGDAYKVVSFFLSFFLSSFLSCEIMQYSRKEKMSQNSKTFEKFREALIIFKKKKSKKNLITIWIRQRVESRE